MTSIPALQLLFLLFQLQDNMAVRRARTMEMILSSDSSVKMYTGLENKSMLLSIYNTVKKRVTTINYWRGPKSAQKPPNGSSSRGKIIDHFDEYVLTLVYIREGMTMRILADWFGLSTTSVTCIINTWINLLYQILKNWLIWPSAEQVKSKLPKNYPAKYADTRVILDCTEFFLL